MSLEAGFQQSQKLPYPHGVFLITQCFLAGDIHLYNELPQSISTTPRAQRNHSLQSANQYFFS